MTATKTERNFDLERLASDRDWWGCLTLENLDAVTARLRLLLDGKRYTFVAGNEIFGFKPEVRTGQRAEKIVREVLTLNDGRKMAHITVCDTYGVWGLHSLVPDLAAARAYQSTAEMVRDAGYLIFRHDRLEIEHHAPGGNKLFWTVAVEPED